MRSGPPRKRGVTSTIKTIAFDNNLYEAVRELAGKQGRTLTGQIHYMLRVSCLLDQYVRVNKRQFAPFLDAFARDMLGVSLESDVEINGKGKI